MLVRDGEHGGRGDLYAYFLALGFVHDDAFDGLGDFVCHFVELVFCGLHVAVAAPNGAAAPRGVAGFRLREKGLFSR